MLDDEVQRREVRRGEVDVGDVERVLVERPDRRPLVDVDVLHAEALAGLEVAGGLVALQAPAAGLAAPLGGVQLDPLDAPALDLGLELLEAGVTGPRVPGPVEHELVGVLLGEDRVALGRVEALRVPLLEVRGLEDRDVDVALLEEVPHHQVRVVALVLLVGPVGVGRSEPVVGVEAVDPPLGVLLLTLRSSCPGRRSSSGRGRRRRSTALRCVRT